MQQKAALAESLHKEKRADDDDAGHVMLRKDHTQANLYDYHVRYVSQVRVSTLRE